MIDQLKKYQIETTPYQLVVLVKMSKGSPLWRGPNYFIYPPLHFTKNKHETNTVLIQKPNFKFCVALE